MSRLFLLSPFKTVELRMANKILRLATNPFDTDNAHQLWALGGPRLARPLAYFAELRSFRRGYRALRLCEDIV